MAKKRMITHDINVDEDFNKLSIESQNLFVRFLTVTDDCGVFPANKFTLQGLINCPNSLKRKFDEYVKELLSAKMIISFSYGGKNWYCFKLDSFDENQKYLIKNRTRSDYLKLGITEFKGIYSKLQENTEKILVREANQYKDKEEVKEKEGGDFEKCWELYPRKLGKEKARGHFKAQVLTEQDYKNIMAALTNYKNYIADNQKEEQFIQHGSTWFNNYWRDWITYKPKGGKTIELN